MLRSVIPSEHGAGVKTSKTEGLRGAEIKGREEGEGGGVVTRRHRRALGGRGGGCSGARKQCHLLCEHGSPA